MPQERHRDVRSEGSVPRPAGQEQDNEAFEAIWAAAAALPPPQRAAFQEMVTSQHASLPCGAVGPGSLHRIIAECQHAILKRGGVVAVGPSPKHGKLSAVAGRAKQARQA